jgi:hypothetical protein
MFGSLWRFLVYRVLGGRVLIGLTVLGWLYRKVTGRRSTLAQAPAPPAVASTYPPGNEDAPIATRTGR